VLFHSSCEITLKCSTILELLDLVCKLTDLQIPIQCKLDSNRENMYSVVYILSVSLTSLNLIYLFFNLVYFLTDRLFF
jgi:hypothetical protein